MPVWIEMYMRFRSLVISLYNALFARAVEKLFFHQLVTKTNNFGKSYWLGKPIWQNTFDLWIAQETIYEVKPSLIIECGTNRGGSAYFYAQLFDLMGTDGKVVSVKDFGAFIELAPGTDGMCHISELDHGYVKSVGDIVSIGDTVKVKVINVDDTGRIKLSRRALIEPPADGEEGEAAGQSRGGGGRGRRRNGDD